MLSQEDPPDVAFHFIDYVVLVGMLALSMLIGVVTRVKRKRSNTADEYLLGNSVMSPFSVAFSLVGGMMSAITVLGNSGEVYSHGTQICTVLVGVTLSGILIYHIILPILYNLSLVSMIQYLELRFQSVRLRRVASASQVLSMLLMSSVMLYSPSLALTTVSGLSSTTSILIMGIICTFYTSIGGVRAVIYADVLQTTIMYLGVILVVVCSCQEVGGLANVWNIAANDSMIQFFNMDPNPFVRNTFWTTNSMGMFLGLYFFGINQVSHQRYCSVSSLAKAKSSVSSCGNSLACLLWDDFLINFSFFKNLTDRGVTATLRFLTPLRTPCLTYLMNILAWAAS
ncbi:hypothetical protein Pcinc_023325 [Petrolisthes cinctipes]|uniref:Sodium-coupled monocarboxylate transporter 1 n=1 Tax=Petrolisthes cinctipes TaxID=88211 RepID=A0AAE1KH06_PETCI|nr:hypothetical protein Pcinc_023325 [Petrolisthes cinctipes]